MKRRALLDGLQTIIAITPNYLESYNYSELPTIIMVTAGQFPTNLRVKELEKKKFSQRVVANVFFVDVFLT